MSTSTATIDRVNVNETGTAEPMQAFAGELYRYHGFRVFDNNGERIGIVDWIWTREVGGRGDHIGLQLQWLRGKATAVPAAGAIVDPERRIVRVPFSKQQIAGAPRFRIDRPLSQAHRAEIAAHFRPEPQVVRRPARVESAAA